MKNCFMLVAAVVCVVSADDVVFSKDSLRIYNNFLSSFADEIMLVNGTAVAVNLDSAFLHIDEMDTAGSGAYGGLGERFKIRWKRMNPLRYDMWSLGNVASDTYRLTPAASSSSIRPSLYFPAPGESLSVAFVEIGTCLGCSGVPTWYPPYFRGKLYFYFDNGQMVTLRLYSEDMRGFLDEYQPCADYACDSMNVRKILDRNGMESVPVSEISSVANGRIEGLQLSYNPAGAVSLPKPFTVLPPEIGNLTALKSITAYGNDFDSISQRIGRCINLQTILMRNNVITALPDSIVQCSRLRYITLENNRLTRLPDSIGKLKALKQISVTGNRLTSLPESMADLDSMDCVFIAGNRICSLPEAVITWMTDVRAQMHCARADAAWPDSQECDTVTAERIPAGQRSPGFTVRCIARGGGFLTVEIGSTGDAVRRIELFDISGRRMESINLSAGRNAVEMIRLDVARYPAGLYYMRAATPAVNGIIRSFVIER